MKRGFFKKIAGALAAAAAAALVLGCSELAGTGDGGQAALGELRGVTVNVPDYAALSEQAAAGSRAVAPQTAGVRLSSAASPAAFTAVTKALSEGKETEGTGAQGVPVKSYTFTFEIPVGEYKAGSLKAELLDSAGSVLSSGASTKDVSVTAEGGTASFTAVPSASEGNASGSLEAGEMKFIAVSLGANKSCTVAVEGGVSLYVFDSEGKLLNTDDIPAPFTGSKIENSTEETVTYYVGIYSADAVESYSVAVTEEVTTVDVTWDWVAQKVTQSSDGSTYGTSNITSGYLKGDSDTIVAAVTGGELKIITGSNPYGQMNSGATIKVPVSSGSVVTVTAWDSSAAGNLLLGGKTLTAISGSASSNTATYTAEKAGYITLKAAANSTYIRSLKVTGLNAADDFTKDVVDFAAESAEVSNDTDTLGLVAASVSSSDEKVATAAVADGKITVTAVAAGSATITAKDSSGNEAAIEVTVGDYGALAIGAVTKYSAQTLYPELGATYVYIFDTAHYAAQDGETDAKGTVTTSSYASDYLKVTGASIASTNHGINGAAAISLNAPAGKTTLTFVSCIYGTPGTVKVKDSSGSELASVEMTKNTDASGDKGTTGASLSFTLSEAQTVTVTIPSGGYTHAIKAVTVEAVAFAPETKEVDLSSTFASITSAESDTESVVAASVSETTLTLTSAAEGSAAVTVSGTDSSGSAVTGTIAVTVAADGSITAGEFTKIFTKFDAAELYGEATSDVSISSTTQAKDGSWELVIADKKKAQVKAGSFSTYDNANTWTHRLSFNKQAEGNIKLKLKVGAGRKVILRVDGGSVKDLPSSGESELKFTGAGTESVEWKPYASGATTYVEITGDADGYVAITSSDTTNGANIYGITVVEEKPENFPGTASLGTVTTEAAYSAPTVSGLEASYTQGGSITASATVPAVTPSTTTTVYADGTLGTPVQGTESVDASSITWTASPESGDAVELGSGASLSFATGATSTETNYIAAGTYSVTASYTIGEGDDAKTYASDPVSVQILDASATYVTVTFDKNAEDAAVTTTTQSVKSGDETALTKASDLGLSRSGYTFSGWAESATAAEAKYTDGASVTFTADTTLYAVWAKAAATTDSWDFMTNLSVGDDSKVYYGTTEIASAAGTNVTASTAIDGDSASLKLTVTGDKVVYNANNSATYGILLKGNVMSIGGVKGKVTVTVDWNMASEKLADDRYVNIYVDGTDEAAATQGCAAAKGAQTACTYTFTAKDAGSTVVIGATNEVYISKITIATASE